MKLKVSLGVLVWTLLISLAHISLNIGWSNVGDVVRGMFSNAKTQLRVGYLPVT